MNKKLITALVAFTLALPITANAAPKVNLKSTSASVPTIAILDTAIDMSQPKFQNSVVPEVCLLEIFFDSIETISIILLLILINLIVLFFMIEQNFYHLHNLLLLLLMIKIPLVLP